MSVRQAIAMTAVAVLAFVLGYIVATVGVCELVK
jgi:hypothetical protein